MLPISVLSAGGTVRRRFRSARAGITSRLSKLMQRPLMQKKAALPSARMPCLCWPDPLRSLFHPLQHVGCVKQRVKLRNPPKLSKCRAAATTRSGASNRFAGGLRQYRCALDLAAERTKAAIQQVGPDLPQHYCSEVEPPWPSAGTQSEHRCPQRVKVSDI